MSNGNAAMQVTITDQWMMVSARWNRMAILFVVSWLQGNRKFMQ